MFCWCNAEFIHTVLGHSKAYNFTSRLGGYHTYGG